MIKNRRKGVFMSLYGHRTYFLDINDQEIFSFEELLSIPLYEGMIITIHGEKGIFIVKSWNFHHGHEDERAGLRVILERQ